MADARPARPKPAASSPVLAALLMDKSTVTLDTLRRTMADLADAGWFRIEWQAAPEIPMVRITRRLTFDTIPRPYEQLVLERIERQAGKQPDVPLTAVLTTSYVDQWWSRFVDAVLDEAKAAGLIRRVVRTRGAIAVMVGSGALSGLATSQIGGTIGGDVTAALFVTIGPGAFLAYCLANPIPTRAGRRLARQAEHGGPDADALPAVGSAVPDVARLPRDQVWSAYGGRWHTVTVPRLVSHRRVRDLPEDRRQVVGQVVDQWLQSRDYGLRSSDTYLCCVDDGVSAEGWLFPVSKSEFEQIEVGDVITMEVMPYRLRFGRRP